MRQRVMIAIALACGPKLLFADEPTTALDVTVQAQILDLLQAQQRERFMAMILVTHDLGVVAGRTDDIAVMYAGRIVEKAPTRTLFSADAPPVHRGAAASRSRSSRSRATPGSTRSAAARPTSSTRRPGCKFAPRCPYAQPQCLTEEPPLTDADDARPRVPLLLPGRHRGGTRRARAQPRAGETAAGTPVAASRARSSPAGSCR